MLSKERLLEYNRPRAADSLNKRHANELRNDGIRPNDLPQNAVHGQ